MNHEQPDDLKLQDLTHDQRNKEDGVPLNLGIGSTDDGSRSRSSMVASRDPLRMNLSASLDLEAPDTDIDTPIRKRRPALAHSRTEPRPMGNKSPTPAPNLSHSEPRRFLKNPSTVRSRRSARISRINSNTPSRIAIPMQSPLHRYADGINYKINNHDDGQELLLLNVEKMDDLKKVSIFYDDDSSATFGDNSEALDRVTDIMRDVGDDILDRIVKKYDNQNINKNSNSRLTFKSGKGKRKMTSQIAKNYGTELKEELNHDPDHIADACNKAVSNAATARLLMVKNKYMREELKKQINAEIESVRQDSDYKYMKVYNQCVERQSFRGNDRSLRRYKMREISLKHGMFIPHIDNPSEPNYNSYPSSSYPPPPLHSPSSYFCVVSSRI